jgi:hypothetical protein
MAEFFCDNYTGNNVTIAGFGITAAHQNHTQRNGKNVHLYPSPAQRIYVM